MREPRRPIRISRSGGWVSQCDAWQGCLLGYYEASSETDRAAGSEARPEERLSAELPAVGFHVIQCPVTLYA